MKWVQVFAPNHTVLVHFDGKSGKFGGHGLYFGKIKPMHGKTKQDWYVAKVYNRYEKGTITYRDLQCPNFIEYVIQQNFLANTGQLCLITVNMFLEFSLVWFTVCSKQSQSWITYLHYFGPLLPGWIRVCFWENRKTDLRSQLMCVFCHRWDKIG